MSVVVVPAGDGYGGRRAQAWVRAVHNRYGTTCHLCGHEGADSADHLHTRLARPDLMYDVDNGRPVHHRRCPVCAVACNTHRGTKALAIAPARDELAFFERTP